MYKELDVVVAKRDLGNVPMGSVGTIVLIHDSTHFEVEFFDDQRNSIALSTVSEDDIEEADSSSGVASN